MRRNARSSSDLCLTGPATPALDRFGLERTCVPLRDFDVDHLVDGLGLHPGGGQLLVACDPRLTRLPRLRFRGSDLGLCSWRSMLSSNARTRVSSVVKSHRWQYPVLGPSLHFGPQHSAVRIWSSVGCFMLPPFYLKKKGRLRCHKRPKSKGGTSRASFKICRLMDVPATDHEMPPGSAKSMQNAELIHSNRHLYKTAPFCELCRPQTSLCSGEALHREHGERSGAR